MLFVKTVFCLGSSCLCIRSYLIGAECHLSVSQSYEIWQCFITGRDIYNHGGLEISVQATTQMPHNDSLVFIVYRKQPVPAVSIVNGAWRYGLWLWIMWKRGFHYSFVRRKHALYWVQGCWEVKECSVECQSYIFVTKSGFSLFPGVNPDHSAL